MIIERVVWMPPATPGSKGDEGMLRGALALLEGFPVRTVNPDDAWRPYGCQNIMIVPSRGGRNVFAGNRPNLRVSDDRVR